MAPPKFSDFAKDATDLLTNDYCFDRKFKLKTRAANGFELTSEGTLKSGVGGVSAKLTGKLPITSDISINKLGVTEAGRVFCDASYSNVVEGLKLTTLVEEGGKGPILGDFGVEYKHALGTVTANLDAMKGPTVKGSLAMVVPGYERLALGGDVQYNTGMDDKAQGVLEDYNVGLLWNDSDYVVSLSTKSKLSDIQLGVHHKPAKDVQVGATYSHLKQVLSFGGMFQFDPLTKIQGKVDSNGIISVNAHQTVSKNVTLIASAQVDAKKPSADTHKFGLQLMLS